MFVNKQRLYHGQEPCHSDEIVCVIIHAFTLHSVQDIVCVVDMFSCCAVAYKHSLLRVNRSSCCWAGRQSDVELALFPAKSRIMNTVQYTYIPLFHTSLWGSFTILLSEEYELDLVL